MLKLKTDLGQAKLCQRENLALLRDDLQISKVDGKQYACLLAEPLGIPLLISDDNPLRQLFSLTGPNLIMANAHSREWTRQRRHLGV